MLQYVFTYCFSRVGFWQALGLRFYHCYSSSLWMLQRVSIIVGVLFFDMLFQFLQSACCNSLLRVVAAVVGCCCCSMFIMLQQLQPNVSAVFSCVAIICSRCFNLIIPVLELLSFFCCCTCIRSWCFNCYIYYCSSSSGVVAMSCLWCFSVFILILHRTSGRGGGELWWRLGSR
jgi:hypothetical protein